MGMSRESDVTTADLVLSVQYTLTSGEQDYTTGNGVWQLHTASFAQAGSAGQCRGSGRVKWETVPLEADARCLVYGPENMGAAVAMERPSDHFRKPYGVPAARGES